MRVWWNDRGVMTRLYASRETPGKLSRRNIPGTEIKILRGAKQISFKKRPCRRREKNRFTNPIRPPNSNSKSKSKSKPEVNAPVRVPALWTDKLDMLKNAKKLENFKTFADLRSVLVEELGGRWEQLPSRYKLLVGTSLAFVICNMDKVNMSLAIIPMAEEFGWGTSVSGLVQSGFFWGYFLCQIPGGTVCSRWGGANVIPKSVALWSMATSGVPFLAGTVSGVCCSRAAVGFGEAIAPSAATDMVARTVPLSERSRTISLIFGGLHIGSILGLLAIPVLIQHFGWRSGFILFGITGFSWVVWFENLLNKIGEEDPEVHAALVQVSQGSTAQSGTMPGGSTPDEIPWRSIFRSKPVRALAFAHFCTNWFGYTMMAWLPSYFTHALDLDLQQAARVSLFPPIAGFLCAVLSGQVSDTLIAWGWDTGLVRKLAQSTAFLGPSVCLLGASQIEDGVWKVGLVTFALGLASFCMGGVYSNHQDLSRKYSSFLLGLTNTVAAIPGIVGIWLTGYVFETTRDWHIALFLPSVVLFLAGTVVFCMYGSAEAQKFDDNQPFEFELAMQRVLRELTLFKNA